MSEVIHGDCEKVLKEFPDDHFDSVCCDPPYELGFMGKHWDGRGIAYNVRMWAECLRVLRPGGHLLAFGGTRTYHRMTCAIEDAGFEIRDSLHWIYGSGFPKSLDVSKAIDKAAGAEREVTGQRIHPTLKNNKPKTANPFHAGDIGTTWELTVPATEDAAHWEGWGTALKPAHEPIVMARKPLTGTVAANVLAHGTGALNIDGCRVAHVSEADRIESVTKNQHADFGSAPLQNHIFGDMSQEPPGNYDGSAGRWAPNILLTHCIDCNGECAPGCPILGMDAQSGTLTSGKGPRRNTAAAHNRTASMGKSSADWTTNGHDESASGGASRFFPQFSWDPEYDLPYFYCAKAGKKERPSADGVQAHPTVKPLALMQWLVRLVTPPDGICLDPFAGTGTTGEACRREGFSYVLIEREADYVKLINARLYQEPTLFDEVVS